MNAPVEERMHADEAARLLQRCGEFCDRDRPNRYWFAIDAGGSRDFGFDLLQNFLLRTRFPWLLMMKSEPTCPEFRVVLIDAKNTRGGLGS